MSITTAAPAVFSTPAGFVIVNGKGVVVDDAATHNEAMNVVTALYRKHRAAGPFTIRPASYVAE